MGVKGRHETLHETLHEGEKKGGIQREREYRAGMKPCMNEKRKEGGIWADQSIKTRLDTCLRNAAVGGGEEEGISPKYHHTARDETRMIR